MSLSGKTIALAEGRQLEELAGMLEKDGATALRCPMVSILDAPDDGPVVEWLGELALGSFDYVVFLTGEGVRRLLSCAERHGLRDRVLAGLARARTVTRGPKPVRALKEVNLAASIVASTPTTEGVIDALSREPLSAKKVGVQLYSPEHRALTDFLTKAGAHPRTVLPYVYAAATDADRVLELIERMERGTVDAIVFTSAPQVARLFEVAEERGRIDQLRAGLGKTRVAAVGPVVAENLREHGVEVAICPEQGFVMKNLVQMIKREL